MAHLDTIRFDVDSKVRVTRASLKIIRPLILRPLRRVFLIDILLQYVNVPAYEHIVHLRLNWEVKCFATTKSRSVSCSVAEP